MGFPDSSVVKNPPANAGNADLILGLERSPGGRNGSPLRYSCLGNAMDGGAWQATVWAVARELDTAEAAEHTHMCELCVCLVAQSCGALCDPTDGSLPGSSVCRDSPGMTVGCQALLQGIFPTQGSNPSLLHFRWILYRLSHKESHTNQLSFILKLCEDLEYMFLNCLGCCS